MRQSALTVITTIRPDRQSALQSLLESIGADISGNPHIPFSKFTLTHFCRWVILSEDGILAFESNYDGELDAYFNDLIRIAGPGLALIYGHCEGYPASGSADAGQLKEYLRAHTKPAAAYYIAYRGESFLSVRSAITVREKIQGFLDPANAANRFAGKTALQIVSDIKADLKAQGVTPVIPKDRPPEMAWGLTRIFALLSTTWVKILLVVAALILSPLLVILSAVLFIWWLILRWHEKRDPAELITKPVQVPEKLVAMEDRQVQNQMTHVVDIRPGVFRAFTLPIVFWLIDFLAKWAFNEGTLGNIPSIHFARWVMVGGGKRVLFFSNFDGSWENYLGDFIDKASKGLTAVWSNTKGFPKTYSLVWEGALDEATFKNWARTYQIHTQVWFSAYPDDSVRNILNDLWIRGKLWSDSLTESDARELLQRL